MREWEDLGGVGERHGTFSWGVEGGEEEDEEGDKAKMGCLLLWDDEAKTRCQQGPRHVGEGEEKESTAPPGINGPDSGPGKDEVDETESERSEQGIQVIGSSVYEDSRRVESDDVDAAHLLSQHDCEGGASCTSDTGNCEEFDEAGDVIALANNICLLLDLSVDVVKITSRLERGISETAERSESVGVSALLDVPSR